MEHHSNAPGIENMKSVSRILQRCGPHLPRWQGWCKKTKNYKLISELCCHIQVLHYRVTLCSGSTRAKKVSACKLKGSKASPISLTSLTHVKIIKSKEKLVTYHIAINIMHHTCELPYSILIFSNKYMVSFILNYLCEGRC